LPTLLKDLEHYCKEDHSKKRRAEFWQKQEDDTTSATETLRSRIAEAAANTNESDAEEDCNNPQIEDTLRSDIIDSDSESIDSDVDDPLKHAGVYTAEEVSSILSEKMHRLQKLYIDQFKHLKYLLKDKYLRHCQASLNETPAVIASLDRPDAEDRMKFKALVRYHRYYGKDALLKRQAKEKRRAVTEGRHYQPPPFPVCIFAMEDDICKARSLPSSHYCFKHILYDVNQVLFRPCANGPPPHCLNPVVSFVHKNTCIAHRELKPDNTQNWETGLRFPFFEKEIEIGSQKAEPNCGPLFFEREANRFLEGNNADPITDGHHVGSELALFPSLSL
jgi:hypothetical protein